ncbi:MAG: hypothetical protein NZO41_01360 [Candidatus Bipolaricaulota bacterium]|nr:hypothetical protein [Candidatus Bipolaricaulota bacterium]
MPRSTKAALEQCGFDTVAVRPAQTPGILVVKVQRLTARAINALLLNFLSRVSESQIGNALVVLEPHRYRVLR